MISDTTYSFLYEIWYIDGVIQKRDYYQFETKGVVWIPLALSINGSSKDPYSRLHDYITELKMSNPNTSTQLWEYTTDFLEYTYRRVRVKREWEKTIGLL